MPLFDPRILRSDPNSVPRMRRRLASVISVETGYTCTIRFPGDGAANNISGVRYLAHVAPEPGASVYVDTDGLDLIIVGAIAGAGGPHPVCRVWRTSNQTGIVSGTSTALTWESSLDPWGMWTSGANVVLPIDGFYQAHASIAFQAASTGAYRTADLLIAGAIRGRARYTGTMAAGTAAFVNVSTIFSGSKGDAVTLEGASDQTGPYAFSQTGQFPFLAVAYIGPAA